MEFQALLARVLKRGRANNNRAFSVAAILTVGLAFGMVMQAPRWAPMAYMTLTTAMSQGTANVDSTHWETGDLSWIGGHFYSNKAPGLSALMLPPYVVASSLGGENLSRAAATRLRGGGIKTWERASSRSQAGMSTSRARRVSRSIADQAWMVWFLGLFGTVIPAVILMFVMRWVADRLQPGAGLPTALALGIGTLVFPFATQLFGHVLSALLLFAGFAVGLKEREGAPSNRLVLAAGVLLGLAVVVEYPTAVGGLMIGLYVVARGEALTNGARALASRAGALVIGGMAGIAPLLIYNVWAFGSVTTISYHNAIAVLGRTGHDKAGILSKGFWGIGIPSLSSFAELFLTPRGLFAATPVLAVAGLGLHWLRRDGRIAEFRMILSLIAVFVFYVAGSWWPIGGSVPGPRYLVPMLPFLCLGLPYAWRRIPSVTLATALTSATVMFFATVTNPIIAGSRVTRWWSLLEQGKPSVTVWNFAGLPYGLLTVAPIALLLLVAVGVASACEYRLGNAWDSVWGCVVVLVWLPLAALIAPLFGENVNERVLDVKAIPTQILLIATAAGLLGVLGIRLLSASRAAQDAAAVERR